MNKLKTTKIRVRCGQCRGWIVLPPKGRRPTYCSAACRQKAYLARKMGGPLVLLKRDLASVAVQDAIRQLIWEVLVRAGLVEPGQQPPPKPKARDTKRPGLKLVKRG